MTTIDIEKTIILHLMACNVPESAIRIVRAANADFVTVSVHAPHGTLARNYSAFQLLNGNPYVVDEMCALAHWYHSENVPVQWREPIPERPHWWHSKSLRDQVLWLCFAGFTLVVILSLAKHLGWYK